jgi:hypothetical protein
MSAMSDAHEYDVPSELQDAFHCFERLVLKSSPSLVNLFGGSRTHKRIFAANLRVRAPRIASG